MESAITIRPAVFEDVSQIPIEAGYEMQTPEELFPDREAFSHFSRSVEKNGRLIAVFGVHTIWPGVGHCFAFIDKDAERFKKTLIVTGRQMVEECSSSFGFWRLQSTVEASFDRGIRYLLALGFNVDGLMPRFGPDRSDHLMMSRLIDG
jgi:hypothetical protein